MKHLSVEAKEAIVAKALSRGAVSLDQIAKDSGVGYSSLQKWLYRKRKGLPLSNRQRDKASFKGSGQRPPLEHLLATAGLDETAVGVYCREQGIHSFQLSQWKDELMTHSTDKKQPHPLSDKLKALRQENKMLKKDLKRKDKALAETSALLVLKKKANLIWGDLGDD